MYYKKQGSEPPITKAGCVFEESYFYDGYLFLKYSAGNVPSEELTKITQEEYEANRPSISAPEPQEPSISATEQAMIQMSVSMEYMAAMMEIQQ